MKKKSVLAALVCLCVITALLPSVALAATAPSVIVGGQTLDGTINVYATTDSVTGAVTVQPSYTETDTWNIQFQNGVLTLRGAKIAGAVQRYGTTNSEKDYAIYAQGELKLVLVDANTVYSQDGADIRAGIRVDSLNAENDAILTIEGGGSLHVYAAAGGNYVHDGIFVFGCLIVNGGAIIAEGNSTDGNSYGIRANTDFLMTGGTLTATGGTATGTGYRSSIGLNASGKVTINGGTLIATGGTGMLNSFGVSTGVPNGITISPSAAGSVKVTAKTTDTSLPYRGAFNQQPIISDGASYTWSLTENDPNPTSSATAPYRRKAEQPSDAYTELTLGQAVATPTISPAAGTYTTVQNVTLTCATAGATIRYTTDGSEPTATSGTLYSAAFPVPASCTVKARAFRDGMSASAGAEAAYTIHLPVVATPVISPAAGTYATAPNVTLTCATAGATIRYTTDGSEPTATNGTPYSAAFPVPASCTVQARAFRDGMSASAVASASYTIHIALTVTPSGSTSFPQGGATGNAVFTVASSDGSLNATDHYAGAALDGQPLDLGAPGTPGADGSVENGSIKITVSRAKLNTLAAGSHTLAITLRGGAFTDQRVTGVITVIPPSAVPKTGDGTPLTMLVLLALLACGGMALLLMRKRFLHR